MIEVYFSICLTCNVSSMRLPLIFFRENTSICSVKVAYNFLSKNLLFYWFLSLCFFLWWDLAAGFYICWGCLVWVPSVYTSPGMYLVNHPVNLGLQVLYYFHLFDLQFNCPFIAILFCLNVLHYLSWIWVKFVR